MLNIFDKQEEEKIIEEYKSGLSSRKIGDLHYVSFATVLDCLERNGVKKRPSGWPKKKLTNFEKILKEMTMEQLADKFGYDVAWLQQESD